MDGFQQPEASELNGGSFKRRDVLRQSQDIRARRPYVDILSSLQRT